MWGKNAIDTEKFRKFSKLLIGRVFFSTFSLCILKPNQNPGLQNKKISKVRFEQIKCSYSVYGIPFFLLTGSVGEGGDRQDRRREGSESIEQSKQFFFASEQSSQNEFSVLDRPEQTVQNLLLEQS